MPEIYLSDQSEILAREFVANYWRDQKPFQEPWVLVPNKNVQQWLQLFMAGEHSSGIAMGLNFHFLEEGLWRLFCQEAGLDTDRHKLAGMQELKMLLARLFLDAHAGGAMAARWPQLAHYLDPQGQKTGFPRRLWQLAARLAGYFSDYMYARPEMMKDWKDNVQLKLLSPLDVEEHALFNEMLELLEKTCREDTTEGNEADADRPEEIQSARHLHTPLDIMFAEMPEQQGDTLPVHVFGFSHLSRLAVSLLNGLGQRRPVYIYQLSVLAREWERVSERPEDISWLPEKWGIAAAGTQALFRDSFSKSSFHFPAREERIDGTARERGAGKPSVLGRLQAVLTGASKREALAGLMPDNSLTDNSLKIVGAPGISREVEMIHSSIIQELENDPSLRLSDIAVLVTDMGSYAPFLEAVFDGRVREDEQPVLPSSLHDRSVRQSSVYGQAVLGLIDVLDGNWRRSDVFRLFSNVCFRYKWRISEEELEIWKDWVEHLGVFHRKGEGRDLSGRESTFDVFTWEQGLERLRLGRIMVPPDNSPFPEHFYSFEGLVPYADQNSNSEAVARISAVMEALLGAAAYYGDAALKGADWAREMTRLCNDFLEIPPDYVRERSVMSGMFRRFEDLGFLQEVDFSIVAEFVRLGIDDITPAATFNLARGITISALNPMRPLPFRHIYVAGLEEGKLPGQQDNSSLDLRSREKDKMPGDLTKPDVQRNLFVETLLCAREKLTLSYVNRDLQKDREIFPCSLLQQLKTLLQEQVLDSSGHRFPEISIPLHGFSKLQLAADTSASAGRQTKQTVDPIISMDERDQLLLGRTLLDEDARLFTEKRAREIREAWAQVSASPFSPETEKELAGNDRERPAGGVVQPLEIISLKRLADFLNDPFSAGLKLHCLVDDYSGADVTIADDETLSVQEALSKSRFFRDWIVPELSAAAERIAGNRGLTLDEIGGADEVCADIKSRYHNFTLEGQAAPGTYGEYEANELKGQIRAFWEPLTDFMGTPAEREGVFHAQLTVDSSLPAVHAPHFPGPLFLPGEAPGRGERVGVQGILENVYLGRDENSILFFSSLDGNKYWTEKRFLETILGYLALVAADREGSGSGDSAEAFAGKLCRLNVIQQNGKTNKLRLKALTSGRAEAYLQSLIEDFTGFAWMGLLPLPLLISKGKLDPAVFNAADPVLALQDAIEEAKTDQFKRGYFHSRFADILGVDVPAEFPELCQRRLAPIFEEFIEQAQEQK